MPKDCKIDNSVKEYSGVNLSNSSQRLDVLYPLLKLHPTVINFWLSETLFPKESKQFYQKLVTSAWDLCSNKSNNVTGFSGTNESRLLLPLKINYHEIAELKGTNGMLLSYLLLPENNNYICLPNNFSCTQILEEISKQNASIQCEYF